MKILQKMPIWILLIIVSFVGIVGAVQTSNQEVIQLEYSLETRKGSEDILEGMAVQVELFDRIGSIYYHDLFRNQTSKWNSIIPLTKTVESKTEYEYSAKEEEKSANLLVYCGSIEPMWNQIQNIVGDEGGTYYVKDYMKTFLIELTIVGNMYQLKVKENALPITCPVTDEMYLKVGPKGKTYGNVSESREVSRHNFPAIASHIPLVFCQDRIFFTISEMQLSKEFFEGTTGILELKKDGTIQVLYAIDHNKKEEEHVIGLTNMQDGLVLLTEKNQKLLAYYYDFKTETISDVITLCENMPKLNKPNVTFVQQEQYLNIKIQEDNCFYYTVELQEERLECVFSLTNIDEMEEDIELLHNKWAKSSEIVQTMYFKEGILYEMYEITYLMNEKGSILEYYSGMRDEYYKHDVFVCAFDEQDMIYYGKLRGVQEKMYHSWRYDGNGFWSVGNLHFIEE